MDCYLVFSDSSTLIQSISSLNEFKSLKRLSVTLMPRVEPWTGKWIKSYAKVYSKLDSRHFPFQAFKGFERLTHLSLSCSLGIQFTERTTKDISVFLPKLRYLLINATINATEAVADHLGRLSRLEKIMIFVDNKSIVETIKTKLIKNCPKIRKINVLHKS